MNKLCYYDENYGNKIGSCEMCNSCMTDAECYGEKSKKYADCILEFIYEEYSDYRYYSALARTCTHPNARCIFKTLAEDELRHSNMFVSAYFLITGRRFCPARNCSCSCENDDSFAETLRMRYFEELCGSQKYAEFAKTVDDKCLKEILLEASEDEKEHSKRIRDIITDYCSCK